MKFELLPVLAKMEDLYRLPRDQKRFEEYLRLLQGDNKKDMILPIAAYNPMAKDHILEKIAELKTVDAEVTAAGIISEINNTLSDHPEPTISVVFNLADDLGGGWTNKFTTDFTSKFKIGALVKRNFCTPYFWTSETYSEGLVKQRVTASIFRTIFFILNGAPTTLKDHLDQEIFVTSKTPFFDHTTPSLAIGALHDFYTEHQDEDNYNIIFNFFYGDQAAASLGFPTYGISSSNGFEFARHRSSMDLK